MVLRVFYAWPIWGNEKIGGKSLGIFFTPFYQRAFLTRQTHMAEAGNSLKLRLYLMGFRPYYKVLYFFSLWLDTALRAMGPSKKLGTFCLITLIEHHLFSHREKWKEIPDTQPTWNSRLIETSHFNSSTCRLVFFEDIPEILDLNGKEK